MKRYGVERCDEGGTLTDSDGKPIDHTWDVVDRTKRRDDGTAEAVSNYITRANARAEAARLNKEHHEAFWAQHHTTGPGTERVTIDGVTQIVPVKREA